MWTFLYVIMSLLVFSVSVAVLRVPLPESDTNYYDSHSRFERNDPGLFITAGAFGMFWPFTLMCVLIAGLVYLAYSTVFAPFIDWTENKLRKVYKK